MSNFSSYCTLDEVKAYGTIDTPDAADDALIQQAMAAAQNFIDTECRWSFQDETRANEERAFPEVKIDDDGYLLIRVDKCPVTAVSSVSYRFKPSDSWTSVDTSIVEFFPTPSTTPHPLADSNLIQCYTSLGAYRSVTRPRVKVTYEGGFIGPTPPATLNWLATRLSWWKYKQRSAPFEKVAMPAAGQVIIPAALPPDLRRDLEVWKRWA